MRLRGRLFAYLPAHLLLLDGLLHVDPMTDLASAADSPEPKPRAWPAVAAAPLPESDPTIDELSTAEREAVGAVWAYRAAKELATAQTFSMIARYVCARQIEPELAWLAARAVGDEVRHAEICRAVAGRYLGRELEWPKPPELEEPRFGSLGPELGSTLLIVLHCCMNETIAGAFLRACQEDARGPLVRAALREILRDEIDHARLGWAHLASPLVTAAMRRQVTAAAPELLNDCRSLWVACDRPEAGAPRGHGCPSNAELARIADEAIAELVLPGLRHVGILE